MVYNIYMHTQQCYSANVVYLLQLILDKKNVRGNYFRYFVVLYLHCLMFNFTCRSDI